MLPALFSKHMLMNSIKHLQESGFALHKNIQDSTGLQYSLVDLINPLSQVIAYSLIVQPCLILPYETPGMWCVSQHPWSVFPLRRMVGWWIATDAEMALMTVMSSQFPSTKCQLMSGLSNWLEYLASSWPLRCHNWHSKPGQCLYLFKNQKKERSYNPQSMLAFQRRWPFLSIFLMFLK